MSAELIVLRDEERLLASRRSWEQWGQERMDWALRERLDRPQLQSEWGRRHWLGLAFAEGDAEPVGSMHLYELTLCIAGQRLRVAGVGSLVVQAERRGEGVGARFLEAAHEWMQAEGFDAALLFSVIGPRFYSRLGYQVLEQEELQAPLADWHAQGPELSDPPLIRPFHEADLPAVSELLDASASRQHLSHRRDRSLWKLHLLRRELVGRNFPEMLHPGGFLVAEREGKLIAYLRSARLEAGATLSLGDWACVAGEELALSGLLRASLDACPGNPPERIEAISPRSLEELLPAINAHWKPTADPMMMLRFDGSPMAGASPEDHLVWATDHF